MIPSFKHGIIASSRPRVVAAASDVTPNPVYWDNISYDNDFVIWTYNASYITGINQTITLKVQYDSPGSTVYYFVSNIFDALNSENSPTSNGMTPIANNGTFTVSNNQWVTFGATPVCAASDIPVTVLNQSDGDVTLQTILMSHFGEC